MKTATPQRVQVLHYNESRTYRVRCNDCSQTEMFFYLGWNNPDDRVLKWYVTRWDADFGGYVFVQETNLVGTLSDYPGGFVCYECGSASTSDEVHGVATA